MSFEAVPHCPSSGVAQPQSSMKESHPAKVHLQEVDRAATASSTSNKSTSLQLLLLLHTVVGDAALRRRNECSRTARAACAARRPGCAEHSHVGGPCSAEVHSRESYAASVGGCIRRTSKLSTEPRTAAHCPQASSAWQRRDHERARRSVGVAAISSSPPPRT